MGRGGWPHTSGTAILAPTAGLFFSTLYFQITHMHTHMHCSATGQGWIRLGRGTVVECLSSHAPQTSLWPSLPLLALSVLAPVSGHFFFSPLTALLQGTWVQMLWRGIWTTFWWWGMGPSGTVKPRWKGSGWGLQNILVQWWITYFHMKSRLNGSRIFEDTRFCKRIQMQR